MSALPDTYPGYRQYVKFPENRESSLKKLWNERNLPAHTGYRIQRAAAPCGAWRSARGVRMGEDRCKPMPELSAVRKAFEDLELVIVRISS